MAGNLNQNDDNGIKKRVWARLHPSFNAGTSSSWSSMPSVTSPLVDAPPTSPPRSLSLEYTASSPAPLTSDYTPAATTEYTPSPMYMAIKERRENLYQNNSNGIKRRVCIPTFVWRKRMMEMRKKGRLNPSLYSAASSSSSSYSSSSSTPSVTSPLVNAPSTSPPPPRSPSPEYTASSPAPLTPDYTPAATTEYTPSPMYMAIKERRENLYQNNSNGIKRRVCIPTFVWRKRMMEMRKKAHLNPSVYSATSSSSSSYSSSSSMPSVTSPLFNAPSTPEYTPSRVHA